MLSSTLVLKKPPRGLAAAALQKCQTSSYNTTTTNQTRATSFPQYTMFSDNCILTAKLLFPQFKHLKNGGYALDPTTKGRLILEWSPRSSDGTIHNGL
jgi:hypothetical protein